MGAWGTGIFENDGSGDFLAELDHTAPADREVFLRESLLAAADAEDYLEVDEGQAAIAAAAVLVAARAGKPVDDGARTIAAADLPAADTALAALAVRALDRVIGPDSEWRELWDDGDDAAEALAAVAEVRAQLA
jgi:hypothetical protein